MDDSISRQAAIRWVKIECNPYGNPTLDFESGMRVIEHLKRMPSTQPEPKHGKWIPNSPFTGNCSECGGKGNLKDNYCSTCGAKMDDDWEEPEINPCRGCEDYDGHGGCKSHGGCGVEKSEE